MSKAIAWCLLIATATILAVISICHPYYLSDNGNGFFEEFVNHEFLSFLGVVVTITLASAANLHLELNKLEEKTKDKFLEARTAVRHSAYSLLILFATAFILVICKPLVAANDHASAGVNSLAVLIVIFNLGVLADLTRAVFRIPPVQ